MVVQAPHPLAPSPVKLEMGSRPNPSGEGSGTAEVLGSAPEAWVRGVGDVGERTRRAGVEVKGFGGRTRGVGASVERFGG